MKQRKKKDGECNDHLRTRKLFLVSGKVAYDANRSPENAKFRKFNSRCFLSGKTTDSILNRSLNLD